MIHARPRIAPIALLLACAGVPTLASAAGLKDKPPEGVTLAGTQWQLDPYNSDDAGKALDRASQEAQRPTDSGRRGGGDIFGGDDPLGRHGAGNDPTGSRFPSDRGSTASRWPPDGGRNSNDIDPTGGNQSMTMQWGTRRGSIFMESLRTNPEKVSFAEGKRNVTVTADGLDTECESGVKAPFSDSYGDGERNCGWNGRAWVVETTRGRQFSRTDRYEISKDGRTLRWTTSASEEGMRRVTIARRYQIPIAR
ncbi:MAG: hypothetical protein WDO68_19355 [Gammaproteobacteria bacterium]